MLAPMTHDPSSQSKAQPTRKLEYGPDLVKLCSVIIPVKTQMLGTHSMRRL